MKDKEEEGVLLYLGKTIISSFDLIVQNRV